MTFMIFDPAVSWTLERHLTGLTVRVVLDVIAIGRDDYMDEGVVSYQDRPLVDGERGFD